MNGSLCIWCKDMTCRLTPNHTLLPLVGMVVCVLGVGARLCHALLTKYTDYHPHTRNGSLCVW